MPKLRSHSLTACSGLITGSAWWRLSTCRQVVVQLWYSWMHGAGRIGVPVGIPWAERSSGAAATQAQQHALQCGLAGAAASMLAAAAAVQAAGEVERPPTALAAGRVSHAWSSATTLASILSQRKSRTRIKSLPRPWYLANLMPAEQTTAWRRAPPGAAADAIRCCRELHRCCCGRNARATLLAARDCAISGRRGATTSGWPGDARAGPASSCGTAQSVGKGGSGRWLRSSAAVHGDLRA